MREVFAHYMVGLTSGQSQDQWAKDIQAAKDAKIDGFALNIGPADSWTDTQLGYAYAAAEAAGGFSLFISFDMNGNVDDTTSYVSQWTADTVTTKITDHSTSSAQFKVDGKPMVSTFEGPDWAYWSQVRDSVGGIYLVPDWSSKGVSDWGDVDGGFSWDAWPAAGSKTMSDSDDLGYKSAFGSKSYMMGVSPWFYADAAGKNWYSSSEGLWYDRWQQVLDVMPDFVEIITWNDFSESSYIADIVQAQIYPESVDYVNGSPAASYPDGFSHSAMRAVLPYFIKAYKAGQKNVALPGDEMAIAWYRTTPAAGASDTANGGATWGQGGSQEAYLGARDVVSVISININQTQVHLSIGDNSQTFYANASNHVNYFEMPFSASGGLGDVTLSMNGKTTTGPAITTNLPSAGHINFNPLAIQV